MTITKDGTIGKVAIVEKLSGKASLNSGIMLIRPLKKHYMKEFMFWILNSNLFSEYNEYTKAGSTIQHLYQETFEDFSFPVPQIEEQRAIASFLDRRTAALDALISKKERLIELLQEKRAALISRAVTKGLDPNAPMKESGVEWLGKIPAHWEVKRIKQIASRIGSGKTPKGGAEVYSESGVTFLRSQNIHFDGIQLNDVVYINEFIDKEMASTRVFPQDILLNITGASLGRCSIVPENFFSANVNQHVCIIRPITKYINPRFLNKSLASKILQAQIFSWENGTSREGLTFSQVANLIMVAPKNLEEQHAIASFLDRETAKIDALIARIREAIEKLREYRTALISAAVTGKIDVREAV